MLMVQNREKPRPQIGPMLPEVLLGKRASEAALNEIVGVNGIPGQSARITAQPRDLCLEQSGKIAHRRNTSIIWQRGARLRRGHRKNGRPHGGQTDRASCAPDWAAR